MERAAHQRTTRAFARYKTHVAGWAGEGPAGVLSARADRGVCHCGMTRGTSCEQLTTTELLTRED